MKSRFKHVTILIIFSLAAGCLVNPAVIFAASENLDLIVKFIDYRGIEKVKSDFGITVPQPLFVTESDGNGLAGVYRLNIQTRNKEQVLGLLSRYPEVGWVQKDDKVSVEQLANDEFYTSDPADLSLQWYLSKISAHQAWDKINQAPEVVIAVIDTGIFASHQDLNDGRVTAGQAIYCQEIGGTSCNLRVKSSIPANADSDDNGHGTAVASVAGAIGNNITGIAGVVWNVQLMPIKVLNKDGVGLASDVAEGIVWAAKNGADIINLSLGGAALANSQIITLAAEQASKEGALVVAAAGNDRASGSDLDLAPSDPVCSDGTTNNVLGVAALDSLDKLASFSNFGKNCIDISAPGVKILAAHFDPTDSSLKNVYAYRSGTSFAAPLVSGAAALVRSLNSSFSIAQVRDRLVNSADNIDSVNAAACGGVSCLGKLGGGRLNIWNAVSNIVVAPPPPPINPSGPVTDGQVIRLSGDLTYYLVEQGKKRILTNFVILQRQINIAGVLDLNQTVFNSVSLGSPLPPLDNTLIKAANHPLVSIIKAGIKRPMTFLSFTKHNYSFASVVSLPDSDVAIWPEGLAQPPPATTVLRSQSDPTVFLVENDFLHAMNLTAFNNRGFKFKDVNYVSDSEIKLYPIGDTYLQ